MMMNFTQHVVSGFRIVSYLENDGQSRHVLATYHQGEVSFCISHN